jgi:hypothetical protein
LKTSDDFLPMKPSCWSNHRWVIESFPAFRFAAVVVGFMAGVAVLSASPADSGLPKSSTPLVPSVIDGPRTPDAERALLHLADASLEMDWVASEPQVISPVAMAWDAAGFLFVAEMRDYPNAVSKFCSALSGWNPGHRCP